MSFSNSCTAWNWEMDSKTTDPKGFVGMKPSPWGYIDSWSIVLGISSSSTEISRYNLSGLSPIRSAYFSNQKLKEIMYP
jgi:hypothetical protein